TGEATPQPHRHTDRRINPSRLRARAKKRKDEKRHGAGDVAVEGEDADGGEIGDFAPAGGVVDGGPGVGLQGLGDVDVEPVDVEGEVDKEEEEGHDEEAEEAGEDVHEGEDEGPDEDDDDSGPAATIAIRASPNRDDDIAVIVNDMVQPRDENGHSKADSEVNEDLPPFLLAGGIQLGVLDVEDDGEGARDSHCRGGDADGDGPEDLDLDIAEDGAVPPVGEVVVGPDEDVDEDHEVEEG
ncbi:hypothetical protein V502_05677, partial [Pseudogymnoascus sp. VKM F-4520 (FW-2644)]